MMTRDEILHELRELADMWLAETEEFSSEDGFEAGKRTCALGVKALVAGAERPASEDEEEAELTRGRMLAVVDEFRQGGTQ